jgi:hypothetical protein
MTEISMATRRTSFDKLQRERAKRAKAAGKRERRQERSANGDGEGGEGLDLADAPIPGDLSAGELMQRLEVLHNRFEAKTIDFDSFEEQKRELLEQLAAIPLD